MLSESFVTIINSQPPTRLIVQCRIWRTIPKTLRKSSTYIKIPERISATRQMKSYKLIQASNVSNNHYVLAVTVTLNPIKKKK